MTPQELAEYRRLASDTTDKEERHPLWANIAILKLVDEVKQLQVALRLTQDAVAALKAQMAADQEAQRGKRMEL